MQISVNLDKTQVGDADGLLEPIDQKTEIVVFRLIQDSSLVGEAFAIVLSMELEFRRLHYHVGAPGAYKPLTTSENNTPIPPGECGLVVVLLYL